MKVALLALLLCQTVYFSSVSQLDSRQFTISEMTADFDILEHALKSGNPGVYRHIRRAAFEAEFRSVRAQLDRPMAASEFFNVIAPAVAAIEDGHAHLDLPAGLKERILARDELLPFGVRVLQNNREYIYRDFTSRLHGLAGSELLSINGRSTQSLVSSFSRTLSEDGDIPTSRRIDSSGRNFIDDLALVTGVRSPYVILVSKDGHQRTLTVAGMHETDIMSDWKRLYGGDFEVRLQSAASFQMLHGSSIAIMRVSSWDDSNTTNLRTKFSEWFAQMRSKQTKTLVVDIRHNGGGEDTLGTLLYSYLAPKPFLYYKAALANGTNFDFLKYADGQVEKDALPLYVAPMKTILRSENQLPGEPTARYELVHRPNLGLQRPSSPHFGGQVLILIDGQSFSTSAEFAAVAHASGRAIFIGEETSGSYYGNDSGITPTIVLPNTRLRFDVPLIAFYTAVTGLRNLDRGVLPDCNITYSIADELDGRDRALETALEIAAGQQLPECTRKAY